MSKPVKNLIIKQYKNRFGEVEGAVLLDTRGIKSNDNNVLRTSLAGKGVRITVLNNLLAKHAMKGTSLEALGSLLSGGCTLAYGGSSVVDLARILIDQQKETKTFEFKGAVLEGELFRSDEIEKLSKLPTREEAICNALGTVLAAGGNLLGAVTGPGAAVLSIVKSIEEKLEKGEAIAKVA